MKKGKVKDIYELDADRLLFEFTDRISSFDIVLPSKIPRKGEILCRFAEYWFKSLETPHHMIEPIWPNKMVVKKLQMIPIECVVRGYLYGSLYDRFIRGKVDLHVKPMLALELPEPLFDPTTKSEKKDAPITDVDIIQRGIMSGDELNSLKNKCVGIYLKMKDVASKANFIIADVKLEFGRNQDGEILLGDSIGPDEFRLWPRNSYTLGRNQNSFDKQLVRDWLTQVGFKKKLDDALNSGSDEPKPPELPDELIARVTERYIYAYEQITGKHLEP
jgi:phosphoribosylaminoimidazole-succinocarboxamide synthase